MNKKLLITGVSGLLGNNLAYYFKNTYHVLGTYHTHFVQIDGVKIEQCDLSDSKQSFVLLKKYNPDALIHCAALASIDQCENNLELAIKNNALSTHFLVQNLTNPSTHFIYISTDSVYDGIYGNFTENDLPNPQNHYGETKLAGEQEAQTWLHTLVLRTNIFGWNIQEKFSLGEWILTELQAEKKINGFKDVYFSSIYTFELAKVINIALQQKLTGIYNCGSRDTCSKYEFARKIADQFGIDKHYIIPKSIDSSPFKVKRGKNLDMNSNRLEETLHYRLPTMNQSLDSFYRDWKLGLPRLLKQNY